MTPKEAYDLASQWANTRGDGACFYNFHPGDARPLNEAHRAECLAYAKSLQSSAPPADAAELSALATFFETTPLHPGA